ncbi:acyl-CoA desaturase [Oscillochloris sp. ZM17-4]|uniref:acyl-CoA desaturase n=1 Tax=Oscillochloris sp. ZM17-4 TaxID=2866714 RepID=UPI001C72F854|nr:acyl-CoA desaturase [Oscillochloris sp. ZM17-4]MBX0331520.1 acyl-CoA desaturase [Oscillochloris sp. ZM17-4]
MARAVADTQPQLEKSMGVKLAVLTVVLVPFIATIYAMTMLWQQYVSWLDVGLMFALYVLSGLGITVGFHRMLTHKSFETSPPLKAALMIMGCLALEGDPMTWASTHIQHHAHSDEEDDPHSPLEGLWHSHVGWLFTHTHNINVYGSWLKRDKTVVWVSRYWFLWAGLGLLIPTLIAGWSGFIWGGLVRIFLTHHITWSVNSICHTFGRRDYNTRDASRNNFIVGLLAFGEGWHNNHHAFPRSAFHGLRWYQVDISGYLIRGLERLGLVWNVFRIKPEDERRRSLAPRVHEAAWDMDVQG